VHWTDIRLFFPDVMAIAMSDGDGDVRQRVNHVVNKTFCWSAMPRLSVQTVNIVIAVTSISNSNTCKLAQLVYLWQFIHIFVESYHQTADID